MVVTESPSDNATGMHASCSGSTTGGDSCGTIVEGLTIHQQQLVDSMLAKLSAQHADTVAAMQLKLDKFKAMEDASADHAREVVDFEATIAASHAGRAHDQEEFKESSQCAIEAKRFESVRLDDTRNAMIVIEEKHARVVADMQARIDLCGGGTKVKEAEDAFMMRLRCVEQERNLLRDEVQYLKVHWQSLLESEQQQHALAVAKLKAADEKREKEREKEMEQRRVLEENLQSELVAQRAKMKAELQAQSQRQPSALGQLFRCPARMPEAVKIPPAVISDARTTQVIVWELMCTMRGVIAMLCCDESLRIVEASKAAFSMWGSAALRGTSALTLVHDRASAGWLKTQIAGAFGGFGGFVRNIGCCEFHDRSGDPIESSVICSQLPAEPHFSRGVATLIIIEPMAREGHISRRSNISARPPQHIKSAAASVTSEDITPDDSISNVLT